MKKLASVFLLFALCATLILPARAEEYGAVTLSGTNTTYAESQVTVVFDQAKVSTEQLTIGIVGDEDGVFDEVIVVDEAHVILVRPDSKVTITDSRSGESTSFWPYGQEDAVMIEYARGVTLASGSVGTWGFGKSLFGNGQDSVQMLRLTLKDASGKSVDYYIFLDSGAAPAPAENPAQTPTDTPAKPSEQETPSSWAVEDVGSAIAAGIVPPALQSSYTRATTRAEFCALATALYENVLGTISQRATFSDTTDVNVEKMAALGVVLGVGNNKFDPDAKLTREQAATMLARLANVMGKPIAKQPSTFRDNAEISFWASEAVGQMLVSGVMNGTGNNTFSPKAEYTREQSILTMLRMLRYVTG